jgi:hypothetical protein
MIGGLRVEMEWPPDDVSALATGIDAKGELARAVLQARLMLKEQMQAPGLRAVEAGTRQIWRMTFQPFVCFRMFDTVDINDEYARRLSGWHSDKGAGISLPELLELLGVFGCVLEPMLAGRTLVGQTGKARDFPDGCELKGAFQGVSDGCHCSPLEAK